VSLKLSVVPDKAIIVHRGPAVVAASWFGPFVQRPYIFPFIGPRGVELTRLGHPLDPVGHSHHRSIWIGHTHAGGVDFWGESARAGRIEQLGFEEEEKEGERVAVALRLSWRSAEGREILRERRRLSFVDLPGEELALDIDMVLEPAAAPAVELGVSNFGLVGIRVARSMRVQEGIGGLIQNSEESQNEAACFARHATWCDYSGPSLAGAEAGGAARVEKEGAAAPGIIVAGIACFQHPANPGGDVLWHVRDDGWMGPSLTRAEPLSASAEKPLRVRYRILGHAGRPWEARIDERYRAWRREQALGGDGGSKR
jgi:hypothetical protein